MPPRVARDSRRLPLLILSDRGIDEEYAPIPSLLALTAVHNHLVREGTRTQVALIIESGEPREVMHFALLIGYGASAVNPYLAIETLEDLAQRGHCSAASLRNGAEELQESRSTRDCSRSSRRWASRRCRAIAARRFRSHRAEPRAGRPVFHRHRIAHRRRRPGCAGARSRDEARVRVPSR